MQFRPSRLVVVFVLLFALLSSIAAQTVPPSSDRPLLGFDRASTAAERALEGDIERIDAQVIRFEVGSAKLPLAEAGRIEDLTAAINRVRAARPGARIAIIGHTDEAGSPEANVKLSQDRAASVTQALAAQGISRELLDVAGTGNAQPLRTGGTEWDQATNRSVSFRVNAGRVNTRR